MSDHFTGTIQEFFGATNPSHLNLWIALHAGFPDWLKGISQERNLPRRVIALDLPHQFVSPPTVGEQAQLVCWIVENTHGAWNITQTWVFFESASDAIKYKLVWG